MAKLRVGLCALAAVLVMAGCSTQLEGTATRAASDEPDLSAGAFGDRDDGLVDPCSLTGPAAFEKFGTARMPGVPSMDECRVTVATDEGGTIVRLGTQQSTATLPSGRSHIADLGRGASIERLGNTCDMALVLADGLAITATAEPAGDIVPSDAVLCGLTEGAVRGVFDVLVGDRAKQWTPEPDSFATVPACDVLSGDQVAQQLGITSDQVTRYPAGHQCRWGRPGGDTATAKLDFPVAESLDEIGVPAGMPAETIAGRESWVVEAGSADIAVCTAYTKHIAFSPGVGTYEHAALRVAIPVNAGKDVCAVARTLAGAGWPNLPAAGR